MGSGIHARLTRLRRTARAVLWAERGANAAAPATLLLLGYLALALFGLTAPWAFTAVLLLAAASLVWAFRRVTAPTDSEIDRRIESAGNLPHRPLAALSDTPALGAERIWAAHLRRIEAQLAGIPEHRLLRPTAFATTRDPFSLRAAILLLLAVGLVFSSDNIGARLTAALTWPRPFAAPTLTVWLTPPAYTGLAPTLLTPDLPMSTLTGTRISVIENGATAAIRYNGTKLSATYLSPHDKRADAILAASGTLTVGAWWHRLASYSITVTPPVPPTITLASPVLGPDGASVNLAWTAADPYGLANLSETLAPASAPHALPETAALPTALGAGTARLDVHDSPYAGLLVSITLRAENLAGASASTPPATITLPAATDADPTAAALRALRQQLALDPAHSAEIAHHLSALAAAPRSPITYAADLQLAALAASLHATPPRDAITRMLALTRQIDAGPAYAANQALAAASSALLKTLQNGSPDPATLAKLLNDLQNALATKMSAAAAPAGGGPTQTLNTNSLNDLAQKIAADEAAGRTAQAQAEMQQLQKELSELQNARPMTAADAAKAAAESQAASALGQTIQGEGQLRDKTGQGAATPDDQGRLDTALQTIRKNLSKAGLPDVAGLVDAHIAMQAAQADLANGDNEAAAAAQAAAITAMQGAAAALAAATANQLGIGQGQGDDPLQTDAPNGNGFDTNANGLTIPGANPADAIQQEIMRRDSNPALPPAAHHYLHRLLTPDDSP
jgi:hypothetical protein